MATRVEVLFAPAEFRGLGARDLTNTTCVVFDVLRATSTIVTALANGAAAVIPVEEIAEALALRRARPDVLLAGERDGLRIGAALTGGVEFDLGNSPREYTPEKVRGKTIVSTTTNGTRALRACAGARTVVAGSFLNLAATARFIAGQVPVHLLLVCAGTGDGAALEDVLAAGGLCEWLLPQLRAAEVFDSAEIARDVYRDAQSDLAGAARRGRNAQRLLAHAGLKEDVAFCLRCDCHDLVPILGRDGAIRRSP